VNLYITVEFAANSHGNAVGGVDRSALTMLGGPYIHTSVCCKLYCVYGRAPRSGRIDGQIDSRLFVGNASCCSKFTWDAIRAI